MKHPQNTKLCHIILLFFTIMVCVDSPSGAQDTKKNNAMNVDERGYSLSPFNVNSKSIPLNFKGHNIVELTKAFHQIVTPERGEFETTEKFNNRKAEMVSNPRKSISYGSLKLGDYVAFPYNSLRDGPQGYTLINEIREVSIQYDADSQALNIIMCDHSFSGGDKLVVQMGDADPLIVEMLYHIHFRRTNTENIRRINKGDTIFSVKDVPPQYAKKNINNLTICCVGRLDSSLIEEYADEYGEDGLKLFERSITLDDVQYWLYNVKTGEVLAKYSFHDIDIRRTRAFRDITFSDPSENSSEPKIPSKKEVTTIDNQGYSLEPFNVNSNLSPHNFKGHNFIDLCKSLEKIVKMEKRESETPEDFNNRKAETISKAQKSISYGSLKLGDYVAFPMNTKSLTITFTPKENYYSRLAEMNYDEDSQSLSISFLDFNIDSDSFFGFTQRVEEKKPYFIRIPRVSAEQNSETKGEKPLLSVNNVSSQYIKENINNLTICCIGQLSFSNVDYERLTVESISSDTVLFPILILENAQFWLCNVETGKVLVKFSLQDLETGTSRELGDTTIGNQTETKSLYDTWNEILSSRKQLKQQSWEKKQPTLIVDSETKNLTDILMKSSKGSVVQIAKGTKINLGAFPSHQDNIAALTKAIAIVGETGDPKDAIIVVNSNEYISIQSSNIFFKGISFEIESNKETTSFPPIIKVEASGDVFFIDCAFQGVNSTKSIGVFIDKGTAKFWNCSFKDFGNSGISVQNEGTGTVSYSEFSNNKVGAIVDSKGKLNATTCFFSNNEIGYDAQNGGGGSLKSTLFNSNKTPWHFGSGSFHTVELDKETNIINK